MLSISSLWFYGTRSVCEFVKLSHTETVIELQRFDQIKENSWLREGKNSALFG